ncbi:MAG: succinate dehydrogenase cytochrome b subunit [Spirochaetia bacterium]|nr:succinate dehydrogenase cytochrome b subunit [Spirochaetia bacterium]
MADSHRFWNSSIGRKSIVALTGSIFLIFLLGHLAGNLQVFGGPEPINAYGETLRKFPIFLWGVRAFFLLAFLTHIYVTIWLTLQNRAARPVPYAKGSTIQASLPSRTMIVSGLLILFYVIYHLMHYTLGNAHPDLFKGTDAMGRHDIYRMVVASFRIPAISIVYIAAMVVLALHIRHGVHSLFQTFGWNNPLWDKRLKVVAGLFSFLIFVGYTSIPAAVLAGLLKLPGE